MRTIGTVTVNGELVTQRQQALIAALALHRTTGATMDTLVDAMWCDRAPSSARKSVQNQVARLRQTFGAGLIVTSGERYRLNVVTDVDLIDRAAAHFDPVSASVGDVTALAEVLVGWRGVPFADLADDCAADAERARLELVQSRLVESLALARLRDPSDASSIMEAVIDLTLRTSTHQLHERAWELLVTALYLSGRRTEALSTYARFGDILHAQLGVTPSRDFQRLRATVDADQPLDAFAVFGIPVPISVPPLLASA